MKKLVKTVLCALALQAAPALADAQPAVQNYAQVCLENQSGHALVLQTSWVGERTTSVLPNGGQHVFRFESTGGLALSPTKPLQVDYRRRGVLTRFDRAVVA